MAREFSRTQRIADQIQRDLAQLIQFEIKDPRLGMVTVSHVRVSRDLGYADIFVTVMPLGEQDEQETVKASLKVLRNAAGFLRAELSRQSNIRSMPHLRFHFDESVERGRHLHGLIEKAVRLENDKPGSDENEE
ncbi:30S ribosome-binding factor RbfA [Marinobacterium jannaschii]|uniref:30S ribosome-binding factor RbfA n=1 Tax=Marinobacterium jannaschii TaxID=64970 RepID=UPI00047F1E6B|nr:30S ribosome-binding factor RbfA [Marinobacterium jannaschii]